MNKTHSLFSFPCAYPLKVLGKNTNEFYATVAFVIEKHIAEGDTVSYDTKTSSGGKYLSVTATFTARSQEQLNAVYQELSGYKFVLMTM